MPGLAVLKPCSHPRYSYAVSYDDPTEREANGRAKRIAKYFTSIEAAEAKLRELNLALATDGALGVRIDAQVRADFFSARRLLDDAGHSALSLTDIARHYIGQHPRTADASEPVLPWFKEFLRVQQHDENKSARWLKTLRVRNEAWIAAQAIATLGDIHRETVMPLRSREGVKPRTRIADMTAVSTFLDWLVEERKLSVNPLNEIKRPKTDALSPRALTADQVATLLQTARALGEGRMLRYFAFAIFAGLRPSEVNRLSEDQIRPEGKSPIIRVVGGKRRQRARAVPMLPVLRAWLKVAPKVMPVVDFEERDRGLFDEIRQAAGLTVWEGALRGRRRMISNHWQDDICRHTFISLRMGMTHDENLVAMESGNSPDVIHAHYLSLMPASEVRALQRLRPERLTTAAEQVNSRK